MQLIGGSMKPMDACDDTSSEDVEALVAASRALVGVAVSSMAALGDQISLVQFRTLVLLSDAGTLKAGELAARLGVSASTVTRACDRLVADGLIRRDVNPRSRREVNLSATRRGAALVKRVMTRRRRDLARILATIPAEDRLQVVGAMRVFAAQASALHGDQLLVEWPVA
jgi:DNA-binding MarR family transcriptional regulator